MRASITIVVIALLSGCSGFPVTHDSNGLTVGTVQQTVYIGASGAEIATVLGSPNIVTTDQFRNEVWIYDRFSSERVRTEGPEAVALLQSLIDPGRTIDSSGSRISESSSQKTLTVVIKFDADGLVHDYAYHTSRF